MDATTDRMPGDAEAAAAIAALGPQRIEIGQRVWVPKAFGNGHQAGTVSASEDDRHLGRVWLVDTPEGRLLMLPAEITVLGPDAF